jgi:hypothetical protein
LKKRIWITLGISMPLESWRWILDEAITFSGQDELAISCAETTPEQLKYEVTTAAYYLPELTHYLKDLPRGDKWQTIIL